jgi:cell division protein FtsB
VTSLRPSWANTDALGVVSLWRVLKALAGVLAAVAVIGGAVRWYVLEVTSELAQDVKVAAAQVTEAHADAVVTAGRVEDLRARVASLEAELLDEVAERVRLEAGLRSFDPAAAARANALFVHDTEGRWPCVRGLACISLDRVAQASVDGAKRAR